MNPAKQEIAQITNPKLRKGSLKEVIQGADVFIGVSAPGALTTEMVKTMNRDAIIRKNRRLIRQRRLKVKGSERKLYPYDRFVRAEYHVSASFRHRALQSPLPLLHAGGGRV